MTNKLKTPVQKLLWPFAFGIACVLVIGAGTISPQKDPIGFIAPPGAQFWGNGAGLSNVPFSGTFNANQFAATAGGTNIKSGALLTNTIIWHNGANDPLTIATAGEGAAENIMFKNTGTNDGSVIYVQGIGIGVANFDQSKHAVLAPSGDFELAGGGSFSGPGSGLTDLAAANLTGTINEARLPDNATVTGWNVGASTGTTPSVGDNDTSLATTAFVTSYGSSGPITNGQSSVTVGSLTVSGTFSASGGLVIPSAAGTSTLSTGGQIALNTTDKQVGIHNGTKEVAIPLVQHIVRTFDPKAVCDGTYDGLHVMTIGPDAPKGITITRWSVSFEADPTTEVDLDLKRADAFIGKANSAVMDVLDTTTGASSETTAANINSGAVVANGKVIYLEFGTAYTEANHQIIFEMWYEVEED